MKNLCKHFSGGVKSEPTNVILSKAKNLKTAGLACILATTALTACNNEESFDMPGAGKLSINVGVNHPTSRALITAATLPDGDAGAIGVMLTDGDGTLTDYDAYTNVKFIGATTSGSQKWTGETDVLLTENPGTLYAYYPWKDGTNLSVITIETASQTDYLYATPVTGISETKANAEVVMNHVLTNINLSFADGTYAGVGNITSVSVSGDGIATGGTFNAAQETPAFVADSYTGVGDAITNTTATTLGGNAIDIMVVSNDAEKPITITATIDGVEYTATTTAVELAKGNSYQYTLTLNSTFMSVSKVTVTPWNNVVKDNLTLEKYDEFDAGIVATYYIDEAQFASRAAEGVEMQILCSYDNFNLSSVDRMKVDGKEVTPTKTYTFTSGGNHTVKYLMKDNTVVPRYMFSNCDKLMEVTIPNSVNSINDYAFEGCRLLTGKLIIPNSVKIIGNFAFDGCTRLTEVSISNSVTFIGERAFYNCKGLTEVTIPNSLKTIGRFTFEGCSGLKQVTIGNSVTSIEERAFYDCKGLTAIEFGTGVKYIGKYAFYNCTGLFSVTMPESVTSIGDYAFDSCVGINEITIPSSVTSIGSYAFNNCTGLKSITSLATTVPAIKSNSFSSLGVGGKLVVPKGCSDAYTTWMSSLASYNWMCIPVDALLENGIYYSADGKTIVGNNGTVSGRLTIKDGVVSIGVSALYGCSGLTEVSIPNSVTYIGERAFYNCTGLTEVTIPNLVEIIGNYAFYNCTGLTGTLTIPNSVTNIGKYAFYQCRELTGIEFGTDVKFIGERAFYNCTGLNKITLLATTAPNITESYIFYNVKYEGTLIVPKGCTDAYATWMSTSSGYLGDRKWTIQEITE